MDCQRRAIANFEPLTNWYEHRKVRLFLLPLIPQIPDPSADDLHRSARQILSDITNKQRAFSSDGTPFPGYVFYHKKRRLLAIRCLDCWVWANFVRIEGKKKMTAQEFNAGFLNKSNWRFFTATPVAANDDVTENVEKART